ncbi:MAG: hypothetical protein IJP67_00430 [Oscillospiraceae bacterium]|nr:hypothetical protein [Oscillospiraceae bacterium]MBR0062612.1 hypothetical protein [Oscillospiraceae bacterium]
MQPTRNDKKNKWGGWSKAAYIALAIIAAITLWLYITLIENPESTTRVTNIPISFTGEELLLENELTITNINTKSLDITFTGRWNNLTRLTDADITASVDLGVITTVHESRPGTYQLSYRLNYNGVSSAGITASSKSYDFVTVTVEQLVTRAVPVRATNNATIADGYAAQPLELSVDTITVSGTQADVSKISYAWVSIERENLNKTVTEEVDIQLMDDSGRVLDEDGFILSQESVIVTLPVLMEKELPITVTTVYGNSTNEENTTITIEPQTVRVSGDPETLSAVNSINLGSINLTKLSGGNTESFPIVIPDGCNNLSDTTTATVTWTVTGLSTKRLSATKIEATNLADGFGANIITQSLDILLRGKELSLNKITEDDITIIADLADQGNTTGVKYVNARIVINGGSEIDAIGEYKVTVEVYIPTAASEETD